MRSMSRISAAAPARLVYRVPNSVVALGILVLAGAFATWGGASLRVVLPAAAAALAIVLFLAARRALRDASARIDAILREELGPPETPAAADSHGRAAGDRRRRTGRYCPDPRAGLDDVHLGGARRE